MSSNSTRGTRFAERAGNRLAYDPGPLAGDPSAVTMIALHDLLADRSSFAPLTGSVAPVINVISPDARGHGASATLVNQWYSMAELAADALAVLDAESIGPAHIAGHGFGGVIALELALRHPDRVLSLTLIEPALAMLLDNDPDARIASLRRDQRASDRAAADASYKGLLELSLKGFLQSRWGPDWKDVPSKARLGAIRRNSGALAALLPALDGYAVARADLGRIAFPTTIVIGEDAGEIDRLVADRLKASLPAATIARAPLGARPERPLSEAAGEALAALVLAGIVRS